MRKSSFNGLVFYNYFVSSLLIVFCCCASLISNFIGIQITRIKREMVKRTALDEYAPTNLMAPLYARGPFHCQTAYKREMHEYIRRYCPLWQNIPSFGIILKPNADKWDLPHVLTKQRGSCTQNIQQKYLSFQAFKAINFQFVIKFANASYPKSTKCQLKIKV